jgi:hypothetical protein
MQGKSKYRIRKRELFMSENLGMKINKNTGTVSFKLLSCPFRAPSCPYRYFEPGALPPGRIGPGLQPAIIKPME